MVLVIVCCWLTGLRRVQEMSEACVALVLLLGLPILAAATLALISGLPILVPILAVALLFVFICALCCSNTPGTFVGDKPIKNMCLVMAIVVFAIFAIAAKSRGQM